MKLKGKIAIVTGGGMGIGRAISVKFAEAGALVIIGDIEEEYANETINLIETATGEKRGVFVRADISSPEDCALLINFAKSNYDKLDILVNNAGVSDMTSVCELKIERWHEIMNVNLDAHFILCKKAIPLMQKNQWGRIVNISSAMGLMAHKMAAAYSVSKAGVVQLTRQMALDYGEDNITVNAICPGIIDTQMTGFILEDEEMNEYLKSVTPLRRIGLPEDVANLALFLSTEEAGFITGTAIPVDGGVIAGTDVLLGPR